MRRSLLGGFAAPQVLGFDRARALSWTMCEKVQGRLLSLQDHKSMLQKKRGHVAKGQEADADAEA